MSTPIIPPAKGNFNLNNYEATAENFQWKETEKAFSWNETGKVNIAYEAIDRHAASDKAEQIALYYSDASRDESYTYLAMKESSDKAATILQDSGVVKGDRVFIFMPRSPELYFLLLGTLKLGAIAGPLFEAFMEGAIKDRLEDSGAKVLVTTPELMSRVPVKDLPDLEKLILVGDDITEDEATIDFHSRFQTAAPLQELEWVNLEDGMILHYTSGSTGKPKGVLHAHRAMIQHYQTAVWVLDFKEGDIYWCTADPGWVTGTSYGNFAPWLAGVTNVVRGGRFSPDDWYQTLEKYQVNVWYSAPTAFRMLMGAGDDLLKKYDLSSVRHVISVGEPLNPEVIRWGVESMEHRIHDSWWMTETGAMLICNYPSLDIKPGSMGKPIPGVEAAIVDDSGKVLPPNSMGNLAIKKGWPAMMKSIWNRPEKFNSYFLGDDWYVSGDSAYMDEEGYFWFQGRIDDVIMTAGERVGPFEIESKLLEHPAVAEAGVIGKPDEIRGEIIKAFISLREGYEQTDELKEEIRAFVKKEFAAHAAPREIDFKDSLPKTRSGKIMRRVLKAWELDLPTGDLSTMEK